MDTGKESEGLFGALRPIDARKQDEARLLAAEARFRSFFELAPIGEAIVSPDGRFLEVNNALCELVGYPEAELLARTFQDITHPDDLTADLEYARRLLAGEIRSYRMEKRYLHRLGRVVWVDLSVSLVRAGDGAPVYFVSQIQDVTERKNTEQRLADAEYRYRTLVEQLPLGTYIRPLHLSSPNVYASPQVEPMLGYPATDWETKPDMLSTVVHPDDRERVIAAARRVRETGQPTREEYRYVRPDGSIVWVQDETYVVTDDNNQPAYVQGFLLDISERKQAEAERDRLRDRLQETQKLEAIGRLAGGVAHNFNNMLTGIRGYSDLLLDGLPTDSPLRKDAEQIKRAVEQAATLPKQLLAFSRNQPLEQRHVDLNDVVRDTTDLLRRLVPESVDVITAPAAEHATVVADPSQLEQVLLNLVLNARDAMPSGGTVTIATRDTKLADVAYTVVTVADTGTGMDAETRTLAFEPFFTTKPQGAGSGLGLASVYGIVKQAGGFVQLESEPNQGTTFELYFPSADMPSNVAAQTPAPAPELDTTTALPTILLAEDDAIVRELVASMLTRTGYQVLSASTGTEALELLQQAKDQIDVLVTDMVMPGVSGRELAERVISTTPRLPIVFMSGYTTETPPLGPNGTPVGSFLAKPFSHEELVGSINQALADSTRGDPR